MKNTIYIIIIVVAVVMVFGGNDKSSSSRTETQEQTSTSRDNSTMAYVQAKNFVKMVLKSPSSADFPFLGSGNSVGSNTYEITSYVDSQNGFGAMIRSNYSITLKYTGGEPADQRNWDVDEFIFDGEVLIEKEIEVQQSTILDEQENDVASGSSVNINTNPQVRVEEKSHDVIDGLGSFSIGSNIVNHRLVLSILYEKVNGHFLYVEDKSLPISAEVKVYKSSLANKNEKELVFSKKYTESQINISRDNSPKIIINPNDIKAPFLDPKKDTLIIELVITTPEQGSFTSTDRMFGDEIEDFRYACVMTVDC